MHTLLPASILATLLCAFAPVAAEELASEAPGIELRQGRDQQEGLASSSRQYRNGDSLLTVSRVPILLGLCEGPQHLNIGATLPGVAATLSAQQRADAILALYVDTFLGRVGAVFDVARNELPLPAAGTSLSLQRQLVYGHGEEQYDLKVEHGMGGEIRARATKIGTVMMRAAEVGEGTDAVERSVARLREQAPVGTWYELLIAGGRQEAALPDTMSLQGWLSPNLADYATVGQARRESGHCTPNGEAAVDLPSQSL